ncbi:DUF2790 domain-containing protein [Pseudomonas sp. LMG 31766]|jgi:hypothetical protein|uniref:DUF2790 domain-containing protein n=1 Tax=Pseudomonas chaetocerotis TaxID=2758695 RepID=A0A931DA17_9PSED|nr:DUF2790 domain-containing protein [Pseudomonas chaetocerotis]MBZ9668059.1 DUF2790 domain-containing protein [Pseudomonas chaetocerotis]
MISKHAKTLASIFITSFALLLSGHALAESPVTTYKYGLKLDVAKVLSISKPKTHTCKPVDHLMKYVDSTGKIQTLKFKALSDACSKGH